jgi:hypothetical protein
LKAEQEDFFEDDPSSEGGDDFRITAKDFEDTFIIPSDWTVSTLRHELADIIDLSPHFQRRSVWSKKAKSRFIESLVLGIPIPQILLAESSQERNRYLVLDGKQRLSTINEFFSEEFDDGTAFKLQGLDDLDDLNGKTWSELVQHHPEQARSIEATSIRTAIIRGWKKDDVLYEIFYRLNSGSVKLSPMELRMSLIRGPFVREVIRQSAECDNLQKLLGLRVADKRMKDVEVAIRHMAFQDSRIQYRGNLKLFLDEYCKLRNQDFQEGDRVSELEELEEVISTGMQTFREDTFSRKYIARADRYERPFNRAIFDVLGGSLTNKEVQAFALKQPQAFQDTFEETCRDPEFMRFIEATTKSIEATIGRFDIWYSNIERIVGVDLPRPKV